MAKLHFKSGIVELFFLAGSTLLLMLMVLSGSAKNPSTPLNKFYWLQADTSSIPGAPSQSRYTFWGVCDTKNGKVVNCNDRGPAVPISPVDNFDTESGVDSWSVQNRDTMYYLSRVAWTFLLIALIFSAIGLFLTVFSVCSFHVQSLHALFAFVASLFGLGAAALYTAAIALGKKHMKSGHIGRVMMGLLWASMVCNLVVMCTSFGTCVRQAYQRAKVGHEKNDSVYTGDHKKSLSSSGYPQDLGSPNGRNGVPPQAVVVPDSTELEEPRPINNSRGINFFKVKRNKGSGDVDV